MFSLLAAGPKLLNEMFEVAKIKVIEEQQQSSEENSTTEKEKEKNIKKEKEKEKETNIKNETEKENEIKNEKENEIKNENAIHTKFKKEIYIDDQDQQSNSSSSSSSTLTNRAPFDSITAAAEAYLSRPGASLTTSACEILHVGHIVHVHVPSAALLQPDEANEALARAYKAALHAAVEIEPKPKTIALPVIRC